MLKRLVLALAMSCTSAVVHAEIDMAGCLPLQRGGEYPFDYNDPDKRARFLHTVESIHFTRPVESLVHGATASHPFHDIAYTLNQIPNHPRALQALLRLAAREKTGNIQGSSTSVECFIKRAIEFAPNDLVPQMTLAQYYAAQGKQEAALNLLLAAEKQAPGNANLAYNIGLLQVDLKRYDAALEHAHSAYLGGFPLPGLRDKLKRAGAWRDPAPLADAKPAVATPPADSVAKPAPAAADTPPVPADKADKAVAATVAAPEQRPADAAAAPKP